MRQVSWIGTAGVLCSAVILGVMSFRSHAEDVPQTAQDTGDVLASVDISEVDGKELFHRSWLTDDPRSPEGDGLGPLFNETSCAGCHNQGGSGGAGPASKNVDLLTALLLQPFNISQNLIPPQARGGNTTGVHTKFKKNLVAIHPDFAKSGSVVIHKFGTSPKHSAWRDSMFMNGLNQTVSFNVNDLNVPFQVRASQPMPALPPSESPSNQPSPFPPTDPAASAVPTPFASDQPAPTPNPVGSPNAPPVQQQAVQTFAQPLVAQTIVAPTANTGIPLVDEALTEMRRLQKQVRTDVTKTISRPHGIMLHGSQRNTTALFGTGAIDSIPEDVIEALAQRTHEDFPRVKGRVHRLPDGKIGRFGWKAQKATLREFTLSACANELGLDVPGHHQAKAPYDKSEAKHGHDMTTAEAAALVAYVGSLPEPIQETPKDKKAASIIEEGGKLFETVGCAACHTPNVGKVTGVYSDFLLHDLGDKLQASGSYGSQFVPSEFDPTNEPQVETGPGAGNSELSARKLIPAQASEWKTPPLWGLRDSAPYLHDGRADTVEQAIALHGGEASDAAIRYFMLPSKKRQRMVAFLKSLRAPEQHASR